MNTLPFDSQLFVFLSAWTAATIAIVVLLTWIVTKLVGKRRVGTRHGLWVIALLTVTACPIALCVPHLFSIPLPQTVLSSLTAISDQLARVESTKAMNQWNQSRLPQTSFPQTSLTQTSLTQTSLTQTSLPQTSLAEAPLASTEPMKSRSPSFADHVKFDEAPQQPGLSKTVASDISSIGKPFGDATNVVSTPTTTDSRTTAADDPTTSWQALGFALWGLGSFWGMCRIYFGFRVIRKVRRQARLVDDAMPVKILQRISQERKLKRTPVLLAGDENVGPFTTGLMKPCVVVPQSMLDETDNLRKILSHECAHLAHRHQWLGLLQRIVQLSFWWHPAVHILNRRLRFCMEAVCDLEAVQCGDEKRYGELLLTIAERFRSRVPATLCMVARRTHLEARIVTLMEPNNVATAARWSMVASMCGAFAVLAVCAALGAPPEPPAKSTDTNRGTDSELSVNQSINQSVDRSPTVSPFGPATNDSDKLRDSSAPQPIATPSIDLVPTQSFWPPTGLTFADTAAAADAPIHSTPELLHAVSDTVISYVQYQPCRDLAPESELRWFEDWCDTQWGLSKGLVRRRLGFTISELSTLAQDHRPICLCWDVDNRKHKLLAIVAVPNARDGELPAWLTQATASRWESQGDYYSCQFTRVPETPEVFATCNEGVLILSESESVLRRSVKLLNGTGGTRMEHLAALPSATATSTGDFADATVIHMEA